MSWFSSCLDVLFLRTTRFFESARNFRFEIVQQAGYAFRFSVFFAKKAPQTKYGRANKASFQIRMASENEIAFCFDQIRSCLNLHNEREAFLSCELKERRENHRSASCHVTDFSSQNSSEEVVDEMLNGQAVSRSAQFRGSGGLGEESRAQGGGAHIQIITELRARLSQASAAVSSLASDVRRLEAELSEKDALIAAQGRRAGAMSARADEMRSKLETLLADRVEDRRTINDLTQKSAATSQKEKALVEDLHAWHVYSKVTTAFLEEYLSRAAGCMLSFCSQRKELMFLRAQCRMWPTIRNALRVSATIELERNDLRDALNALSDQLAELRDAHSIVLATSQKALSMAQEELAEARTRVHTLEESICRHVVSNVELPPLVISAAPTVAVVGGLRNDSSSVSPPNVDSHVESNPSLCQLAVTCPAHELEKSLRISLEEQLSAYLCSGLSRVEEAARFISDGDGCVPRGNVTCRGSDAVDFQQNVAALRSSALEVRHERLEAAYAALQQRVIEEDGVNEAIRRDLQELQHYLAHVETELICNGSPPAPRSNQFNAAQPQLLNRNQHANGAASKNSGKACFVCQQHVPSARSVQCCRCSKNFHKSCCGFPKNESTFVCCANNHAQQHAGVPLGSVRSRSGASLRNTVPR